MCPTEIIRRLSKCASVEKQLNLIELILRQFRRVSELKLDSMIPNTIQDISKPCRRRKSMASYRNDSKNKPNWVFVESQLHPKDFNLRYFQIVFHLKIKSSLTGIVEDNCKFCRTRKSIEPFRNYSKSFSLCVLAEIQLHLIEINLKQFKIVF